MKRYIKFLLKQEDLIISFIPSISFMFIYKLISFKVALMISLLFGCIIYSLKILKYKKLTTLNILGVIGLITSTLLGLLTNNPTTMFLYPIISNFVYGILFTGSYFTQNDIISSIAKSFIESDEVFITVRPGLRFTNLIWGGYYIIKVFIKLIMIKSNISFDIIYSINWLMGYPVFISLYLFSYKYSERYYLKLKRVKNK